MEFYSTTKGTNYGTILRALKDPSRELKNGTRSLFNEDGVLYSYGHHHPLALRVGREVWLNNERVSSTTGRHASFVRRAARALGLEVVDATPVAIRKYANQRTRVTA